MKINIATRLLVFFLLVSMIPLGIAGFMAYRQASDTVRNQILERLETLAQERAGRIERVIQRARNNAGMLAQMPSISAALEDFTRTYTTSGIDSPEYRARERENESLLEALTSNEEIYDLIMISPQGDVVLTLARESDLGTNLRTGRYRDTEMARVFDLARDGAEVVTSKLEIYEPSGAPAVFMAAPVRAGDRLVGVLELQIPTDLIDAVAGDYSGLKETGETVLVSAQEDMTTWIAPTRHDPGAAFTRRVEQGSGFAIPAQEATSGGSGRGVSRDYRGVPVLAAWRPIPSLRLGLVIKMDEREALAPVNELAGWFLFLGLGTLLAVLAASLLIARSISHPILTLTRDTERMADGDLTVRSAIRTGDEIGVLGTAFNTMVDGLEKARDESEEQNTALKQMSSELEIIIDSIPGLVFYKDTENRYLRVNKYIADMYKLGKAELEGVSLFDIHSREEAQAYLDADLEVINSGTPKLNIDEPWETVSGTRWVSTSKIPYQDKNGKVVGIIGVSLDVTERRMAEEELARRARVTNAINRIFREANTCETVEELGKMALRVAEELTGSRFGFIGKLNAAGLMDTIAMSNPGWDACDIIVSDAKNSILNMPLRGIDRTTLMEGRSRIVNAEHLATHPDRVGLPQGHPPITCFLGVPFKQEDRTVGMIGLANKEGGYSREDQEAVEMLSTALYEALFRKQMEIQVQEQAVLKTSQAELSDQMRGDLPMDALSLNIITFLCRHLEAQTGLMYLADRDGTLRLTASYAHKHKKHLAKEYKPGEGLVGQAAFEGKEIIVTDVPEDYFAIESGLGEAVPRHLYIKPVLLDHKVKAVIELGTLHEFAESRLQFMDTVNENIAIAIQSVESRTALASSLEESQELSEELQAQQEELRTANEELEEQTQRLVESEEELKSQQEELQVTNEELEEKNELQERQKMEIEHARKELEVKAGELTIASRYKSEFLANMSHELRTPLNSLLLLAQSLVENKDGNLTGEQVESARIIHGGGIDLLNLINEILDLSKIEAGRVDLKLGAVQVGDLAEGVRASFAHMARGKGLGLEVVVSEEAPAEITSDHKRVEQVIRNLVSNAVKFTESGNVTVNFGRPDAGTDLSRSGLSALQCLAVVIKDTGIGIAPDKQKIIFEAFQQVDGSTGRRFGGTGLGLSISRELVRRLGGEIQLESRLDEGSTFTLFLPVAPAQSSPAASGRETARVASRIDESTTRVTPRQRATAAQIEDDREELEKDDRVILVIEDDPNFARILYRKCHEKGFKCLAATTGEEGLELANRHVPNAVLLDIRLPGMDGWAVLSALKEDIRTRHVPVHIVSVEEASTEAIRKGAIGHVTKPLDQEDLEETFRRLEQVSAGKPKRVLVVEDDAEIRRRTLKLISAKDVKVDEVETGSEAMQALRSSQYDCVVLDLGLPDMSGLELVETLKRERVVLPPVIIHTARDLTLEEEAQLREHAESIVIKDIRSQERLLDEVSLFLHRVVSKMPQKKQQIIRDLHDSDALLKDVKVLIVDDDMRTTFAMSHLLSKWGMKPLKAENGKRALRLLDEEPDVGLVFMDIMMPVMDGYETMKRIRSQDRFRKLPIIALTAKAMPEDREKCLAAGANDYLSKPVDQGRLISMIRVWLYR